MRALSSVGLERYLDTVEVTGSNPVEPTPKEADVSILTFASFIFMLFLPSARIVFQYLCFSAKTAITAILTATPFVTCSLITERLSAAVSASISTP